MTDIFDLEIQVEAKHIDVLGHVNNVVYVQWMQDIASAHVEYLGLGVQEYLKLKHAMVAVEHHVQYRKAALDGESVILRTWLDDINALYLSRQYAFYRPEDKSILFLANTKWTCIEIASGRPKRMSPSFTQAYQPISTNINPFDFEKYHIDEK
ncbi:thioesterase [Acinetobacter sp. ANC 4558]|uniref:acyl-CoA thioesterase n=1 Tax=Acinetobacter sp. ANC 4558 TaxID=1977876 RepID=UPI000A3382E4|nr:thioesterase family protein [Acinetobacter sp. ANC 4558]OTG86463.1 thioesterase [Acinetobacter sp. ANC 4558]